MVRTMEKVTISVVEDGGSLKDSAWNMQVWGFPD